MLKIFVSVGASTLFHCVYRNIVKYFSYFCPLSSRLNFNNLSFSLCSRIVSSSGQCVFVPPLQTSWVQISCNGSFYGTTESEEKKINLYPGVSLDGFTPSMMGYEMITYRPHQFDLGAIEFYSNEHIDSSQLLNVMFDE